MTGPRRGSVWSTDAGRDVLVISSTIYNEITSEETVVVVPVFPAEPDSGFGVDIGTGWALPNRIATFRKTRLTDLLRQADTQALTSVNNMLFRILATPER